ncbi:MAG: hypothetical protein WGN25_19500 [Candidatus Electrothrix sp. GW3-4]|uniref:hypothetical protein n=1 Tax=Candidatus Electrothrix sp. GW3-4 TaxID=3126740 RepID=UPI0030CD6375
MICTKKTTLLTLSLATAWSVNALAFPSSSGPIPPPEAYTACEGKQLGEKASLITPQGHTLTGTCEQQKNGRLFLRPDRLGKGRGNGRPPMIPPAAYQDCMGKKRGDQIQITTPTGRTITGTCQTDGDRLYLQPDAPPGMGGNMRPQDQQQQQAEPAQKPIPKNSPQQYQQVPQSENTQTGNTRQQAPYQNQNGSSSSTPQQNTQQQQPPQTEPQNSNSNTRPKAPEAAYTACEGKKAGDEAQLTTSQGRTISGTCQQDGDRLFLRPQRPASANNGQQQQQAGPTDPVEQPTAQQPQQPVQQPMQQPQEKPKGFLEKAKDFWKNLW